jgi:hypothetical protein
VEAKVICSNMKDGVPGMFSMANVEPTSLSNLEDSDVPKNTTAFEMFDCS